MTLLTTRAVRTGSRFAGQRFTEGRHGRVGFSLRAGLALLALPLATACSLDKFVGGASLPDQVLDPAQTESPGGALAAYRGALVYLRDMMVVNDKNATNGYVVFSGQLSDELRWNIGAPLYQNLHAGPDHRQYDETYEGQTIVYPYFALQRLRGQANQAHGLIRDYRPGREQPPMLAHMLAVRGYAELLLAELYCSGIPLSTLNYKGDFTYRPASSTDEVLTHAVALFDSALAIVGGDSTRILNLARVGKGRALLQMGKFMDASQAVADVPPDFSYALQYSLSARVFGLYRSDNQKFNAGLLGDREGGNGLPFVSERDARLPRMEAFTYSYNGVGGSPRAGMVPVSADRSSILLASGIEAQLIRAEAALRNNDASWLTMLNQLRTSCVDPVMCSTPAPRGTGGVDSLALLVVPQDTSDTAKVNILFRERAYWLFLTGHRVGDLRRLIRFYARNPETVFPTGEYDTNVDFFGSDVNLPVPRVERDNNPVYRGCLNRSA